MESALNNEFLMNLLVNYGSIVLFVLLALGIIALPVPEETLMIVAGAFMQQGLLSIPFTFLAALAGSICGISVSYWIGRTGGFYLLHKYGGWAGITEAKTAKVKEWFHHFGKWALSVGYFIPGVRHLTGVVAGMTALEFPYFALYAYTGALAWVTTFIGIGYFFGEVGISFLQKTEITSETLLILAVILVLIYLVYKTSKE